MAEDQDAELLEPTVNKPIVPAWLWWTGGMILIMMIVVNVEAYFASPTAAGKGQWGDFFGGMLNPILSFLAFVGLLYTILLQQKELGLSREELRLTRKELANSAKALGDQNLSLKKQRFESAFFGMVGVLNQIIDNMDVTKGYDHDREILRGRDCFSKYIEELNGIYEKIQNVQKDNGLYAMKWEINNDLVNFENELKKTSASYSNFYKYRKSDLGHYFRVLYNIFRYIRESDFPDGVYSKILRAQLSNQELIILFYNCLSDIGANFKELAEFFEIFDNLDSSQLVSLEHRNFMSAKALGKATS